MELTKNFEPAAIEIRWTDHWKEKGYFNSTPDERPAFTVVIPPPMLPVYCIWVIR